MRKSQRKKQEITPSIDSCKGIDTISNWVLIISLSVFSILLKGVYIEHISPLLNLGVLDTTVQADVFTRARFNFLIIFSFTLLCILFYKILIKNYEVIDSPLNIPLALLAGVVLLSLFFADYKSSALIGQPERYEGTLAFICYLALFFIAQNIYFTAKMLDRFMIVFYISAGVNAVLSVSYFYGFDFYQTYFVRYLIAPTGIHPDELLTAGSYLCTTYENPNYASGIGAVFFCVFSILTLQGSDHKKRIINGFFCLSSFALVIASLSTSGFLAIVVMLPIMIFLMIISKGKKFIRQLITTALVITVGIILIFTTMYWHQPAKVWKETLGFFGELKGAVQAEKNGDSGSGESGIKGDNTILEEFYNELGVPQARLAAGSGRAYVWKETVKLIMARPLFGYGMDTLIYYYPNYEISKFANLGGRIDLYVSKPHNYYLFLAYGTGLAGLALFVLLMLILLYQHAKRILNKELDNKGVYMNAFLMGWCAYLVQGVANDPVIGTSVIFWVILGITASKY